MVIERIEENIVVINSDDTMDINKNVPRSAVEACAKEGDVVIKKSGFYIVDKEETAARRAKVRKIEDILWKK